MRAEAAAGDGRRPFGARLAGGEQDSDGDELVHDEPPRGSTPARSVADRGVIEKRPLYFRGRRGAHGAHVTVCSEDWRERALALRLDLWNHSPSGFEWGYGGSGPAQLALALLVEATGNEQQAVELHQAFKWAVTSKISDTRWMILAIDVRAWAEASAADRPAISARILSQLNGVEVSP